MTKIFPIIPAPDKTLWVISLIFILLLGLNLLFGYLTYSVRHVEFKVTDQALEIRGDIYGKKLPKTDLKIDQALIINLDQNKPYQPKWRTNGVGLPGYLSGWFRLKNGEKALLFITKTNQVIYLPTTKGYAVMMSVKQPEELIQALHQ